MSADARLLCGLEALPARLIPLRAGPFTALFDPGAGALRYLRLGDHEVLRAMYATFPGEPSLIQRLEVQTESQGFRIQFELGEGTSRGCRVIVSGTAEGRIELRLDPGTGGGLLQLTALHPIHECAGKNCTVEHDAEPPGQFTFPRTISPEPLVEGVRALTYEPAPAVKARVRFEGGNFNMEDGRNLGTAAFQTSASILPASGGVIGVSLLPPARKILPILQGRPAQLSIATTTANPRPALGWSIPNGASAWDPSLAARTAAIRPAHFRVDLDPASTTSRSSLEGAVELARIAMAPLQIAVSLGDDVATELSTVAQWARDTQAPIGLWLLGRRDGTPVSAGELAVARQCLSSGTPGALFATGSGLGFRELNRHRPEEGHTAFPFHAWQPDPTRTDLVSLIENLSALSACAETIRSFSPRPVVLSSVTLGPGSPGIEDLPQSLFAAAWWVGILAQLAATSNVHSVTCGSLLGGTGLLRHAGVSPAFHVFADLADAARLYPTHSTHPLQTEGITLVTTGNRRRLLVANFLAEPQELKIKSGTGSARVRVLDETTLAQATSDPESFRADPGGRIESVSGKIELHLRPFAVARVDFEGPA